MAILVRTDKNGTKYWYDENCPKCGGRGYIYGYEHVEGGRCFKCGGTGYYGHSWKEYTPEYAAKLEERRLAKMKKQAPEFNQKFFKKNGFNEEGFTWIVLGNTFEIKEELKAAGAKYNNELLWHFNHEQTAYPCVKVSIEELAEMTAFGTWSFDVVNVKLYIENLRKINAPKTESQHIGNVGDKVDLKVTLTSIHTYETNYTYYGELHFIYKFSDENSNTIVWKTSNKNLEEGKIYQIKGRIKEHNEYNGDKQTVLTRCKVF